MKKNMNQLIDGNGRWINIYQVWNAAGVFVTKATAAECRRDWAGPQYQFSLLHEVAA